MNTLKNGHGLFFSFFLWCVCVCVGVIKNNLFYYGGNIPFFYYLLTLSFVYSHTHFIIFITDYELTL